MKPYQYQGDELETFAHARNWKAYLRSRIEPFLSGDVLEVGAGVGSLTRAFAGMPVASWMCLEPDPGQAAVLSERLAGLPATIRNGTLEALEPTAQFDAILYVDVLEHIEDDRRELAEAASRLRPGGRLIVMSPAHQWLFTPFDARIGHHRRYSAASLTALTPSRVTTTAVEYLDAAGMLLSVVNKVLLRSSMPTRSQILIWDRLFVPLSRLLDPLSARRIGKSLLVVWTAERR